MGLIARLFGQFARRSARVPGVVPSAPLIEAQHHEYFAQGQEAFLRGDLDEARVWFGKLEAENTRLGIAWYCLAIWPKVTYLCRITRRARSSATREPGVW